MTPEALADHFREKLGDKVTDTQVSYGALTVTVEPSALPEVARFCKDDPELDFAFFDYMAGIDCKDEGFAVVTHLYSVQHRHHVSLRAIAPGGRDEPKLPSITDVYRGANWHEREAYDMFGVEFEGHPGLLPRILTVENFEGFPLRKEFLLSTREAKPWPGLKEPAEVTDEESAGAEGAAGSRTPGAAGGDPTEKARAAKEKAERAKKKAAEMRANKARERAGEAEVPATPSEGESVSGEASGGSTGDDAPQADLDAPDEPIAAADAAGTDIAKDAAAGTVTGDTAAGPTQDASDREQPVEDRESEEDAAEGGEAEPGGSPGVTEEGRTDETEPAPPPGAPQSRVESPRRDEPQGTEAPAEPAHSPAADVRPVPREEFEEIDPGEPEPAAGTDATDRRGTGTAADRRAGDGKPGEGGDSGRESE